MRIVQLPHRPPSRRLRTVAIVAALVLHVGAALLVPFPVTTPGDDAVTLILLTDVDQMAPPLVGPRGAVAPAATEDGQTGGTAAGQEARGPSRETAPAIAGAIPFLPRAPESESAAGMAAARAATLPLVVREGGGFGGRRLGRTVDQLAIAQAESLLMERLAGIAVVERRDTGKVGLANGGITIAIPWGGFLPADRNDGEWREERCSGGGDGDSDKAGEGEARRAQCD